MRLLEQVGSSGTKGEGARGRFKPTCGWLSDIRDNSDNGTSSSESSSSERSNRENLGSEGCKGAEESAAVEGTLTAVVGVTRFRRSGD